MFKEEYISPNGRRHTPYDGNTYFMSCLTTNGDGSYHKPFNNSKGRVELASSNLLVLSGGHHDEVEARSESGQISGQNMYATMVRKLGIHTWGAKWAFRVRDMNCFSVELGPSASIEFYDCIIGNPNSSLGIGIGVRYSENSIFYHRLDGEGINISFYRIDARIIHSAVHLNSLYEDSIIDMSGLSQATNYLNFSNCKFKPSAEGQTYELDKNATPEERRAELVQWCIDNGIKLPAKVSDMGQTGDLLRWSFYNDCTVQGSVIPGSELDKWQIARGFHLGYKDRNETNKLSISNTQSNQGNIHIDNNLEFVNQNGAGTIQIRPEVNTGVPNEFAINSGVISLGYKQDLKSLGVHHDFPRMHGLSINSDRLKNSSGAIMDIAGKATAYIRLVDELPEPLISNGFTLTTDHWYYVSFRNGDKDAKVRYDGKDYPAGSSFLVREGVNNYSLIGNAQIHRCWHKHFRSTTVNDNFWNTKTKKPILMRVVLDDIRGFYKNNNDRTNEVQFKDGEPLTSGHKDFYPLIVDKSTTYINPKPLRGKYLQIITQLNTADFK